MIALNAEKGLTGLGSCTVLESYSTGKEYNSFNVIGSLGGGSWRVEVEDD